MIELWTDGSCNPNPGIGGWACIINDDITEEQFQIYGSKPDSTNNRMELTAVIKGLTYLRDNYPHEKLGTKIIIVTDSQLTMNCAMKKWKRKKNQDLWDVYDRKAEGLNIQFKKVKGHSNIHFNEEVDRLANLSRLGLL